MRNITNVRAVISVYLFYKKSKSKEEHNKNTKLAGTATQSNSYSNSQIKFLALKR